jgi:hypothetical protein
MGVSQSGRVRAVCDRHRRCRCHLYHSVEVSMNIIVIGHVLTANSSGNASSSPKRESSLPIPSWSSCSLLTS